MVIKSKYFLLLVFFQSFTFAQDFGHEKATANNKSLSIVYGIGYPHLTYLGLRYELSENTSISATYGMFPMLELLGVSWSAVSADLVYDLFQYNSRKIFADISLSKGKLWNGGLNPDINIYSFAPMLGYETVSESGNVFYYTRLGISINIGKSINPLYTGSGSFGGGFYLW